MDQFSGRRSADALNLYEDTVNSLIEIPEQDLIKEKDFVTALYQFANVYHVQLRFVLEGKIERMFDAKYQLIEGKTRLESKKSIGEATS